MHNCAQKTRVGTTWRVAAEGSLVVWGLTVRGLSPRKMFVAASFVSFPTKMFPAVASSSEAIISGGRKKKITAVPQYPKGHVISLHQNLHQI